MLTLNSTTSTVINTRGKIKFSNPPHSLGFLESPTR